MAVAAKAKALVAVVLAFALSPKVAGLVVGAAVVAVDVAPNKNAPPVWVLVLVVVAVVVLLAGAELVVAVPAATPKTLVRPEVRVGCARVYVCAHTRVGMCMFTQADASRSKPCPFPN